MNKFKNQMGVHLLAAMFFEQVNADKSQVIYTLKDQDHEGYPSLKRLYLDEADITEYQFAKKYLDGYAHWKRLCECPWFKEYITAWRAELHAKLYNRYLSQIEQIAESGGREAFAANRYLLEALEKPAGKISKGPRYRGSAQTEKTLPEPSLAEIADDAKRLLS